VLSALGTLLSGPGDAGWWPRRGVNAWPRRVWDKDQGQPAAKALRKQAKSCTFSTGGAVLLSQLA
jgi:hypothetical protein